MYTIGYGTREIKEFLNTLTQYNISMLVDVRTHPYSKFRPEFSRHLLEREFSKVGIQYVFMGDSLGGRPKDADCYSCGRVLYSVIQRKPYYQRGIEKLLRLGGDNRRLCLMCSEGSPDVCHRSRLIGVSLQEHGKGLMHILPGGTIRKQTDVLIDITGGQQSLFGVDLSSAGRFQPRGNWG